ncbi:MAG TPA: hypothetical protein PLK76_01130 [bacterium]|nr:hypothetical protein [bacterium]
MDIQEKINQQIASLNEALDFKEYFKLQREINHEYLRTWDYAEFFLKKDAFVQYELLIKSFDEKLKIDQEKSAEEKAKQGLDDKKLETMKKFNEQVLASLSTKDYQKTSEQMFYVILGNVIEHAELKDIDLTKFDLAKDLYPKLKAPLSLAVFLFQNLTFGPIALKINSLSSEYLQKYCALFLCLWRSVFDFMAYERMQEQQKQNQSVNHEHNHQHGKGE